MVRVNALEDNAWRWHACMRAPTKCLTLRCLNLLDLLERSCVMSRPDESNLCDFTAVRCELRSQVHVRENNVGGGHSSPRATGTGTS